MSPNLTTLREKIARLETGAAEHQTCTPDRVISLDFPAVDAALPWGGLPRGAIHELLFPDAADGAATAFALHVLSQMAEGPDALFLWSGCRDDLHAPGFVSSTDPGQVLFVRAKRLQDVLWSVEEGLRCPDLTAIVADAGAVDFSLSRRLSLAAADSGGTLLMLQPCRHPLPASAAATRWRIACAPDGCWRLDLLRCKGGRPGSWLVDPTTGETIPDRRARQPAAQAA